MSIFHGNDEFQHGSLLKEHSIAVIVIMIKLNS